MSWNPLKYGVDYFLVQGQQSPGIARVAGHGPPRKWEERNGYGLSGSSLVYLGNGLAKWDTEIELYTEEDWNRWNEFKGVLQASTPGKYEKAQDFWHPFLEEHEIRSAVLLQPSFPKQVADGVWVIKHDWMQYRRLKLSLAKPEGSKAQEKPTDPADAAIDRLVNQTDRLARNENVPLSEVFGGLFRGG